MSHLSREQLSAMLDGALGGRGRDAAERHLEQCAECREALARLAGQDESLKRSLDHDPGDVYFETFAERVARRIESEAAPRRERAAWPVLGRWWGGPLRPASLAWVGSAIAVVVVAGIVIEQVRESRGPLTRPEIAPRADQQAPRSGASDELRAQAESAPSIQADRAAEPNVPLPDADDAARSFALPPGEKYRGDGRAKDGAPGGYDRSNTARREMQAKRMVPVPPLPAGEEAQRAAGPSAEAPLDQSAPEPAPSATPPPPASTRAPAANEGAAPGKQSESQSRELQELKRQSAGQLEKLGAAQGATSTAQGFAAPGAAEFAERDARVGPPVEWPATARAFVTVADSLSRRAERSGKAADFDVAAAAWSLVSGHVTPRSPADVRARMHAADLGERAWSIEPTDSRRRAAITAIDRFLEIAPPGPGRDRHVAERAKLR